MKVADITINALVYLLALAMVVGLLRQVPESITRTLEIQEVQHENLDRSSH